MNIRARLDRLERTADKEPSLSMPNAWNAPVRQWQPSCICFPYSHSLRMRASLRRHWP